MRLSDQNPYEEPTQPVKPGKRFLGSKAGRIALVAALLVVGIIMSGATLFLGAFLCVKIPQARERHKAYNCAKEAAEEAVWSVQFPSFKKAEIHRWVRPPEEVEFCEKAWTISGTMIYENRMRQEMYAHFEADVILYSYGSYECISFIYK